MVFVFLEGKTYCRVHAAAHACADIERRRFVGRCQGERVERFECLHDPDAVHSAADEQIHRRFVGHAVIEAQRQRTVAHRATVRCSHVEFLAVGDLALARNHRTARRIDERRNALFEEIDADLGENGYVCLGGRDAEPLFVDIFAVTVRFDVLSLPRIIVHADTRSDKQRVAEAVTAGVRRFDGRLVVESQTVYAQTDVGLIAALDGFECLFRNDKRRSLHQLGIAARAQQDEGGRE